jgi:pyridinium-3,5-biscarboxylic acid mononucleotide sulfurtransferase
MRDDMMEYPADVSASSASARYERLTAVLRDLGSVCVGFSGGVDSAFLAVAALRTLGQDRMLAVTGLSPAYPAVQRATAQRCAREFGIPHLEIDTHELSDERYSANPANRCYYCKSELWPRLAEVARERRLAAVLDGSNADDAHDYRPGFAAARENGVRAPLLEVGLTKADIRELSRELGLPTWDQPSAPCLASRLPYGIAVTPERLAAVERAESELRALGFRELRVRHHDDCLRIELAPAELSLAERLAGEIQARLAAAGAPRVVIDAEGYRRGALNEALVQLGGTRCPSGPLPAHETAGFHGDIAIVDAHTLDAARSAADALRAAGFRYVAVDVVRLGAAVGA